MAFYSELSIDTRNVGQVAEEARLDCEDNDGEDVCDVQLKNDILYDQHKEDETRWLGFEKEEPRADMQEYVNKKDKSLAEPTKEQWAKWANHKSNKDRWIEQHNK